MALFYTLASSTRVARAPVSDHLPLPPLPGFQHLCQSWQGWRVGSPVCPGKRQFDSPCPKTRCRRSVPPDKALNTNRSRLAVCEFDAPLVWMVPDCPQPCVTCLDINVCTTLHGLGGERANLLPDLSLQGSPLVAGGFVHLCRSGPVSLSRVDDRVVKNNKPPSKWNS